jgi:hypothetical protein
VPNRSALVWRPVPSATCVLHRSELTDASRLELRSAVFEYIEAFYNRWRRHSTLEILSPVLRRTTTTLAAGWLRSIVRTTTIHINTNTRCHASRGRSSGPAGASDVERLHMHRAAAACILC